MSNINIDSVLSQIRAMQQQAQGAALRTQDVAAVPKPGDGGVDKVSFSDLIKSGLDEVNRTQQTSGDLKQAFTRGDPNTSLIDVMIAGQKAQVEFRATVEVRNRLVSAYQDIMNMPI